MLSSSPGDFFQCGVFVDFQQWLANAANYFHTNWQLDKNFSAKVALFYAYLSVYGLNPRVNSGRRDAAKQKAMQEAWDRGDRAGLKVRPATISQHTEGLAIDIETNNPAMAAQIAKAIGLGDGYSFAKADPVHFYQKA